MSEASLRPVAYVNLLNPGLLPTKKGFTARSVTVWGLVALIGMVAVAWWAWIEKESVSKQVAEQAARLAADAAHAGETPTPQQIAALEQLIRVKKTTLDERRAQRDALKRGLAIEGGGPSAILRLIAESIPNEVWITELTARADRLDVTGRTTNPAALAGWMNRLGEMPYFAAKPISAMHLVNSDFAQPAPSAAPPAPFARASVYSFNLSAQLAQALAEDGGRAP